MMLQDWGRQVWTQSFAPTMLSKMRSWASTPTHGTNPRNAVFNPSLRTNQGGFGGDGGPPLAGRMNEGWRWPSSRTRATLAADRQLEELWQQSKNMQRIRKDASEERV